MLGSGSAAWADAEYHPDRRHLGRVDGDAADAGAGSVRTAAGANAKQPAPRQKGWHLLSTHAADARRREHVKRSRKIGASSVS